MAIGPLERLRCLGGAEAKQPIGLAWVEAHRQERVLPGGDVGAGADEAEEAR